MAGNDTSNGCSEDKHNDFKAIFDVASVGIVQVHTRDGRIIKVNDKYCQITGYTEEELQSMRFSELTHPDDRQENWELFSRAVRGELPFYINEKRYVRKDGSIIWVRLNAACIRDNDGTPVRTVAVCEDITVSKQTKTDLQKSEERLRAIITASTDVVYSMSADWSEMLELRSQDFLAATERLNPKWLEEYIPTDEQPLVKSTVDRAIQSKSTFELEHRIIQEDGNVGWTFSRAIPIFNDNGDIIEWFGVATDITERKFREANLTLLAEISKDFASFLIEDEIVQSVGKRLGTSLNISGCFLAEINEVQGTSTIDYYWSDGNLPDVTGVHKHMSFVTNEYNGTLWSGEAVVIQNTQANSHTNAKGFAAFSIFAYITVPFYQQDKLKYLFTVTNSTPRNWRDCEIDIIREVANRMFLHIQRFRAEALLRKSEERYRILSEQLQEANRRKDEFLGTLSHEIRNPMASITLGLSLLERSFLDEAKVKQAMSIMKRQVSQLSRLIDDLLDVTRISRNLILLKKEQVELNALILSTLEDYQAMYQDKGIELALMLSPIPLYVEADPNRLVQILGNLLHNAIKFTGAGGVIRVTLSLDTLGQLAVVCIEDNGIGMEKKTVESLFIPFLQADSSLDRSNGGLGLGLALVKGLIELHGGTVKAYSDGLGKGSKFTLCLPLAKEYNSELGGDNSPGKSKCRHRVLIIEDIKDVADILKLLLEEEGHDIKVANDGTAGIAMAKEFQPDVILCDIGLPGMDGYQIAKTLRSDKELQNTLLISLTGYARPEDVKRSQEAGFHFQLAKPIDLDKLRQSLAQAKINHEDNQTA
jgi:PAS domain S-box-containing protein